MRGKLLAFSASPISTRITPAYAGKTKIRQNFYSHIWDHPRVCGENLDSVYRLKPHIGSPPRMRGKPGMIDGKAGANRITPAYAGKTTAKSR